MLKKLVLKLFYGKAFCLLAIALCFCSTAFSQTTQVTGVVRDSISKETLVGVSVFVRGSSTGVTTNREGRYTINVPNNSTIIFRYVGYDNKAVDVNGRSEINLNLASSNLGLDEVVVVAYGTQKKQSITGAINSIQTKEIKQSPAANLAVSLAGRLPGLTAIQTSGEPGRDLTNLYLRGQGSVNGQAPLILVDGVERDITYIDPNEVATVTILKDASSTAVFGVRGANGVILVTTRRGKSDKPEINLTAEYGLNAFTHTPSQVDSYEYTVLKNQAFANDYAAGLISAGTLPPYSADVMQHYKSQDEPLLYPNTNYNDLLIHKYVPQTRYNLNLSGGGNYVDYFVNAGYLDQGGQWKIQPGLDYDPSARLKRYNFRTNIDAYLNKSKTLKAFLNVAGYLEKVNQPAGSLLGTTPTSAGTNTNLLLANIYTTPNITPGPLTPGGDILTGNGVLVSAYGDINRSGYVQETRSNVTASFGMEQDLKVITPGLSAKFMMSFDSRTVYDFLAQRTYASYTQTINPDGTLSYTSLNAMTINTPLNVSTAQTFQNASNIQLFLNYNRTFGKSTFTGLVLAQQDEKNLPQGPANPTVDWYLPFHVRGLSTRETYGYDNKYFAEFDAGYNGSEQFGPSHRYGFFPSVSAAWLVSNEKFLKNNNVLTTLKLRGSYGKVGGDQLGGSRFLYLDNIKVAGGGYSSTLGNGNVVNELALGNPNIQWEVSTKINVGLEIGLFNSLDLIADVFNEQRNNMLIPVQTVPALNGYPGTLPPLNEGRMSNHGYEIEMKYHKSFNRDLSVVGDLNFNYAKNIVQFVDQPELSADYAYRYRQQGYSYGQNFGMVANGYWNNQAEINSSGLSFVGVQPRPGDLKFEDLNHDNIIDARDQAPIGYSNVPQYTYAASLSVTYKQFDVSALFQGVFNVSNYFTGFGVYENSNNVSDYRSRMVNAWTPERAAAGSPITFPALSTSQSSSESVANSFFLENTSYLRLKNAEIGYSLPARIAGKIGAQRVRIYANGLNLVTWDKMKNKDFDPEVSSSLTYPIIKTFNFGVNVTF